VAEKKEKKKSVRPSYCVLGKNFSQRIAGITFWMRPVAIHGNKKLAAAVELKSAATNF
jgi:hypothetical protein